MRKNFLRKMISAGDFRKSRFHTEKNIFIGWRAVAKELPITAIQKFSNYLFGRRRTVPWWPLPAVHMVESKLRKDMIGIEFGSGSSSVWIAKRVSFLVSREHDDQWAEKTEESLNRQGLTNCSVERRSGTDYFNIIDDQKFDFAIIDGEFRWKCLNALSGKIRSGGFIYLDNSDSDKDLDAYERFGETGKNLAQETILKIAKKEGAKLTEVHGLITGEIFAGSGIIIEFP